MKGKANSQLLKAMNSVCRCFYKLTLYALGVGSILHLAAQQGETLQEAFILCCFLFFFLINIMTQDIEMCHSHRDPCWSVCEQSVHRWHLKPSDEMLICLPLTLNSPSLQPDLGGNTDYFSLLWRHWTWLKRYQFLINSVLSTSSKQDSKNCSAHDQYGHGREGGWGGVGPKKAAFQESENAELWVLCRNQPMLCLVWVLWNDYIL